MVKSLRTKHGRPEEELQPLRDIIQGIDDVMNDPTLMEQVLKEERLG